MRRILLPLTFALGLLTYGTSAAMASPIAYEEVGQVRVFRIPNGGAHVTINIHPEFYTVLIFSDDIVGARALQSPLKSPFEHRADGRAVTLWVRSNRAPGSIDTASMEFATKDFMLNVSARITPDPEARLRTGLFVPAGTPVQDEGASSDKSSVDGEGAGKVSLDGGDLMTLKIAMGILDSVRRERKGHDQGQTMAGSSLAASCEVQVDTGAAEVDHQDVVLVAFGVINRCADSFAMSEVKLRDSVDTVSYLSPPSIWKPEGGKVEPRGDVLADIAPGEEVVGMLMVNANAVTPGPLTVKVIGTAALQAPGVAAELYEIVKKKPPFVRTVSLHVQAVGGWIWLANPLDKESLDPTGMTGLGMRVSYHLVELIAVEVDVVGASSGNSRFEGVDYGGQQGDLLRRASLGRVSFGGALRLSSGTFIPVMRLGLGLQGASHTAEMDVGGVRMPGPEVGFEVDATLHFGTGLDIRLGDYFLAGISASYASGLKSEFRAIEAGVHLGYSWKP